MKRFEKRGDISFEIIDDVPNFVPNQAIDINEFYMNGVAPPEATNLEYDSDDRGENVSFDDAAPIIPDKIAAMERLNELERQYALGKEAAEKAAAEAQKMAAAADTAPTMQVADNQPSENAG